MSKYAANATTDLVYKFSCDLRFAEGLGVMMCTIISNRKYSKIFKINTVKTSINLFLITPSGI